MLLSLKNFLIFFVCFYVSESSEISLQLLETLIKNCGDHVHFQVVERNILEEMMKIVKKKVTFDFSQFPYNHFRLLVTYTIYIVVCWLVTLKQNSLPAFSSSLTCIALLFLLRT